MAEHKTEKLTLNPDSPVLIFKNEQDSSLSSNNELKEPKIPVLSVELFKAEVLNSFNIIKEEKEKKKLPSGTVENHFIHPRVFEELYNSSEKQKDETSKVKNLLTNQKDLVAELGKRGIIEDYKVTSELKSKRLALEDPQSKDFMGPWAIYEDERQFYREVIPSQKRIVSTNQPYFMRDTPGEKFPGEMDPYYHLPKELHNVADTNFEPKAIFHLESKFNYQNESFLKPTKDKTVLKNLSQCFIPNKCLFTYKGHTKQISVTKFFPKYGQFIISGSYDKSIKLWDVFTHRKNVQTYLGHTEAINDISMSNDGTYFLSSGFDSRIQYWDTETGKIIKTFNVLKHPYCVRLNPDEDRQHMFLTGSINSRIDQYDIRSGSRVTQYPDHTSPVNTIIFVDNNKKFVSCGDDRKILLYEFGTPVILRSLNELDIQPITRAEVHPCKNYFVGQTTDNNIFVFDVKGGNLRRNRKKKFVGHVNAGFAVKPIFSPNGFYLLSGDHTGRINAWDWKTEVKIQGFPAHSTVVNELDWHPNDSSLLVSGSFDHTIRLWTK